MIIALTAVAIAVITVIFIIPGSEPGIMNFNGTDYTFEELKTEFGT